MKKTLLMVAAVATALLMSSCKEKEENRVLSTPEHQEKMENAINSFVAANPVEGFETFAREIHALDTTYFHSFDLTHLMERAGLILDVEGDVMDTVKHTSTTTVLVALANMSGTYDFGKDTVVYTPSNEGTFINLTLNEDQYNLSLRQLGNIRTVLLMDYRESVDLTWDETNKTYPSQSHVLVKLDLPDQLVIDLTKNGAPYGNITLTPVMNISEGGLDVRNDNVYFTASVTLNNYTLTVNSFNVDLKAEKASGNAVIANAGQEILNLDLAADIAVRHTARPFGPDSLGIFNDVYLPSKLSNLKVNVRLMNQVELRGECDNVIQALSPFVDYIENGSGVKEDEPIMLDEWARKVDALNSLVRVNLYFTGNVASQAHMTLEPYFDYEPYSDSYGKYQGDYCMAPLIVYPDGTRFSPFEYAAGLNVVELVMFYFDFVDMLEQIGIITND